MTGQQPGIPHLPFVVIAQLSALPHYRIAFYRELARVSAGKWNFGVVFDPDQASSSDYTEELGNGQLGFTTLPVRTWRFKVFGRAVTWQGFGSFLPRASLLITDTHLLNLSYPCYSLIRPRQCKWALWGHTTNRNLDRAASRSIRARLAAIIKKWYINRARAVLAYSQQEAESLAPSSSRETYVVPNTIDLENQRSIATDLLPQREAIRQRLGLKASQRLFITIGRLLPGRRIDFLLNAFHQYIQSHPDDRLVIIGGGDISQLLPESHHSWLILPGAITDPNKVGEYLAAADVYIAPGMIGLGILPPLIYELPLIAFDLPTHGPEIDYLNENNCLLLSGNFTPQDFARFLTSWKIPPRRGSSRYQSIAHLTLAKMAAAFDASVCKILGIP